MENFMAILFVFRKLERFLQTYVSVDRDIQDLF